MSREAGESPAQSVLLYWKSKYRYTTVFFGKVIFMLMP